LQSASTFTNELRTKERGQKKPILLPPILLPLFSSRHGPG
jgi:hypothetical protein